VNTGVRLGIKVLLDGPYDAGTMRMRDDLRTAGLIPVSEPYTAMNYVQAGGGGGETRQPNAFSANGDDAIVDWVLIELRNAATPSIITATRAALVQRDGDVVAEDGLSAVALPAPSGSYRVAVRHRNHLGIATAAAVALSGSALALDLTNGAVVTYGTNAQKLNGPKQLMWPGDAAPDGTARYVGNGNDRDPILIAIGGSTPTNVVSNVYSPLDVNMDGQIKYVGNGNDRDPILTTVGGSAPTNVRVQQLP
jgi:hypothetical protein